MTNQFVARAGDVGGTLSRLTTVHNIHDANLYDTSPARAVTIHITNQSVARAGDVSGTLHIWR